MKTQIPIVLALGGLASCIDPNYAIRLETDWIEGDSECLVSTLESVADHGYVDQRSSTEDYTGEEVTTLTHMFYVGEVFVSVHISSGESSTPTYTVRATIDPLAGEAKQLIASAHVLKTVHHAVASGCGLPLRVEMKCGGGPRCDDPDLQTSLASLNHGLDD